MPTVLVTGAGRGLGLEFVRQYAAEGWDVLACARAPEQSAPLGELAAHSGGRVGVERLDVADFAAVDALAGRLDRPIDVLINNAGTMGGSGGFVGGAGAARGSGFGASRFEDWAQTFRLNTFAPMKMAEAFAGHVGRSREKKIIALSTVMASMARNTLGGFYAYRASKAGLNAIMVSMALDLGRKHGIIAAVIHPGWVRTDMGGPGAQLAPEESVAGMRRVIAGLTAQRAGHFLSYDGSELPW